MSERKIVKLLRRGTATVFIKLPEDLSKMRAPLPYSLLRSEKSTQYFSTLGWDEMRWGRKRREGSRILLKVLYGGKYAPLLGRRKLATVTVS